MKKTTEIYNASDRCRNFRASAGCNSEDYFSWLEEQTLHPLVREDGSVVSSDNFGGSVFYCVVVADTVGKVVTAPPNREAEACWYKLYVDGIRLAIQSESCARQEINSRLRNRAADILSLYESKQSRPPILHVECKRSAAVKKSGRLAKKNSIKYEEAARDIEDFVLKNMELYAEWVNLASSLSLNDSGIVAGARKKKHLSR